MEIGTEMTIYVRALSNNQWFGAWAPVTARLEWRHPSGQAALFTLTQTGLDEEDEYEFYQRGALLLTVLEEGDFRARTGMSVKGDL